MFLLVASGFDSHVAPHAPVGKQKDRKKNMFDKKLYFLALSTHPSPKGRPQFLSRPNVMEEAMKLA
jgi:hypothetical protein